MQIGGGGQSACNRGAISMQSGRGTQHANWGRGAIREMPSHVARSHLEISEMAIREMLSRVRKVPSRDQRDGTQRNAISCAHLVPVRAARLDPHLEL